MRKGGGQAKGAAFERQTARDLSRWLTKGQSDELWRSSLSGGRATLQLKAGVINRAQSGDLSAISSEGWKLVERYFIEIKSYRDLQIAQAVTKDTGNLAAFWKKTASEAVKYRKYPLLIAKQNRYPTIALVRESDPLFAHVIPLAVFHVWGAKVFQFDAATRAGTPSILTDEIWRPIPGYDEHYVSSLGRVRKLDEVLKSPPSDPRYVYLREGEQHGNESIARLVLLAFVGLPPQGKSLACHLDDDVQNNAIWNVAWGSHSDNSSDLYRNGGVDLAARNAAISTHHQKPENRAHMSAVHSGKIWINNGIISKKHDPETDIPDGWSAGRTTFARRASAKPATEVERPRLQRPRGAAQEVSLQLPSRREAAE